MPAAALVGVAEAASWLESLPLLASVPAPVPLLLPLPLPLSVLVLLLVEEAPVAVAEAAPDPVVVADPVLVAAAEL